MAITVITPTGIGRGLAIVASKVVTDVPDTSHTIPGASAPSDAGVQAYLATISPVPLPGTLLVWGGTATQPDVVYVVDKAGVAVKVYSAIRDVYGKSPGVINATTGINNWANGAVQSTPIATLSVTNPSANNPLVLEVNVYHGILINTTATASPKTQTVSGYSVISFDTGGGTLQAWGVVPEAFGTSQIACQSTQHDVGAFADAGQNPMDTLFTRVTVAAGATVTLRAQSTLNVRDGHTSANAWSFCGFRVTGKVTL